MMSLIIEKTKSMIYEPIRCFMLENNAPYCYTVPVLGKLC